MQQNRLINGKVTSNSIAIRFIETPLFADRTILVN